MFKLLVDIVSLILYDRAIDATYWLLFNNLCTCWKVNLCQSDWFETYESARLT